MPDDLTSGEIMRRFDRIERDQRATDDRITQLAKDMVPTTLWASEHEALEGVVAELRADMQAGFGRVEDTARERKSALDRKDAELAAGLAEVRREAAEDRAERDKRRPGVIANWITAAGVVVALVALIVTLVTTHGGH